MRTVRATKSDLRRIVRGIIRENSDFARSSFEAIAGPARGAGATPEELAAVEEHLPEMERLARELAMATRSGNTSYALMVIGMIDKLYQKVQSSAR